MSWNGIGLISRSFRNVADIDALLQASPALEPSPTWDGTAASGFTAVPVDPVRTTAKPAVRLITPPFQWFTDTLDVGVMAAANDSGSLFNTLGIADVTFHYEGSSVTVTSPSWHTIPTKLGPRTYFGWWVQLKKPAGVAGHGHLYVEATARDGTMQKRVIGPYTFSPQDTLYDAELTIAPSQPEIIGQRYQALTNAIAWVKASARVNPLLTITEPGIYNFGTSVGELYTNPGYVNVTASVAGVVLGRTVPLIAAASNLLNDRCKLHIFGPNITMDFKNTLIFEHSAAVPSSVSQLSPWLDGVTITNTEPGGSDGNLFGVGGLPRSPLTSGMFIGGPWFTEVSLDGLHNSMIGAKVIRGCVVSDVGADIANHAALILQSRFEGSTNGFWNDDRPAFSVQYTGPEATATIARSGNVLGSNGGIWSVKIGATTHTLNTGRNPGYQPVGGGARTFGELVAWLNTLPDITATLLIEPFDRIASSGTLPGFAGQGFGDTNIKTALLTVVSNLDIHGDFYQHQAGGNLENNIIAFNEVLDYEVQILFLSPPNPAPRSELDVMIFGNVFHAPGNVTDPVVLVGGSQWGRPNLPLPASHVVIAHNTWVNQQFLIRNEGGGLAADAYCLMRNNVMPSISVVGGDVPNLTIDGLHLFANGVIAPAQAVNVTISGTPASLFADADAFNFSPAGELLAGLRTAALTVDFNRVAFPASAPIGALVK